MSKPTICFSILNAVASLPDLHNLSDAGAGAGLMGFTPASNSEMIASGHDITRLQVYEQGLVVEGCGLGGCLVLAEQLGFSEQQILTVMDDYTERHIASFGKHEK